jgi:drug/metabolite transporter (DMT)-like permease
MSYYLPMGLLILSVVIYQVSFRLVPQGISSWHVLFVVYALGALLTFILGLSEKVTLWQSIKQMNGAILILTLGVVGIELGYLLTFRAGWPLTRVGLTSNVGVALLVIPIGILFFKERLSLLNILGIILCVLGLILVVRR